MSAVPHHLQVVGLVVLAAGIGLFCELVWEHTQVGHEIDQEDSDES